MNGTEELAGDCPEALSKAELVECRKIPGGPAEKEIAFALRDDTCRGKGEEKECNNCL